MNNWSGGDPACSLVSSSNRKNKPFETWLIAALDGVTIFNALAQTEHRGCRRCLFAAQRWGMAWVSLKVPPIRQTFPPDSSSKLFGKNRKAKQDIMRGARHCSARKVSVFHCRMIGRGSTFCTKSKAAVLHNLWFQKVQLVSIITSKCALFN